MSLTRASYHQRSLYLTPTGQNRAVKRLYIRHLAGKRTVPKGGCLRGPVGAYRGGELALGWCWPRRSARLWSGGAQLCLGAGEAERGFAPTSAAAEPCLPGLALFAFGRALERGLFLWQPSRAFEGVSQDPFHLTVGAAHLIVRPALDGLSDSGVYTEWILLACHDVPSCRMCNFAPVPKLLIGVGVSTASLR